MKTDNYMLQTGDKLFFSIIKVEFILKLFL
jgi:hypothetical protein